MSQFVIHQNAFAVCEDMRVPVPDRKTPVFCPKPRRVGKLAGPDPIRPLRWQASFQADLCDAKAGPEFLDFFLIKCGGGGGDIASSPPFFCGSPPTRSANPVVHDVRFGGEENPVLASFGLKGTNSGSPISPRKICGPRATFGLKPAQVRVEGFDCLDRNRGGRSQSIPAMA